MVSATRKKLLVSFSPELHSKYNQTITPIAVPVDRQTTIHELIIYD